VRTSLKYRLLFLFITITCYYLGFNFIPERTDTALGLTPVIVASVIYFAVLPVLYWFMIIKAGKQKAWKLLIILSLSSTVARYSYPEAIAQHFDFILWLRYPIMAILLIIELYLIVIIVKSLWQARNLSGDPRIGAIEKYDDDKKQGLALTFATEPASWYYAIPRLSRKHIKSLDNIILWSGKAWHFFMISALLVAISILGYQLLVDWSQTAAIMLATFILYSFILLTANYRLSRHHSLYIQDDKLIINNSIFNFMVVPLDSIASVSLNTSHEAVVEGSTTSVEDNTDLNTDIMADTDTSTDTEANVETANSDLSDDYVEDNARTDERLKIGRGKQHNIKITFKQPIKYWGMMGSFVESFDEVLLKVEQPTQVINALAQINSPQPQVA